MTAQIQQKSKRITKLVKALEASKDYKILLGFFSGATYPNGMSVPLVAQLNEYGFVTSKGVRVPSRPFLRPLIHNKELTDKWNIILIEYYNQHYKATSNAQAAIEHALELVAEEAKSDLKQAITDLRTPPNSPITIAKKGSSNPLIDTNVLRNSATSVVVK